MIHSNASTGPVLERIQAEYPGIRQALDARRRILADSQWFRDSCEKQEDPIHLWEIKVREKAPRGRKWITLLEDGKKLLSSAGNLYLSVLGSEQEALRQLKSAAEQLRDLIGKPDLGLDPRMAEMLDQCVRLREQETRWIEEIVNLTHRIETLNGEATPDQVRSLLELRRRYLDQIRMLKETSRALEDRAFQKNTHETTADAPKGPSAPDSNGNPDAAGATVEEILDVEFEDLDQKLRKFRHERDQALSSLAKTEAKLETETDKRESLEKELARTETERDEAVAAREKAKVDTAEHQERTTELTARVRALEEENGEVIRRLAEAEALLVEAEKQHREQETLVEKVGREKDNVQVLLEASREKHDLETNRREELEKLLRDMTGERDKTLSLLAESESRGLKAQQQFETERNALRARIETAQCDRDATEARRLDELKRLREAVRSLTSRVDDEIKGYAGADEEE